jgi:hypothetical protein
MVVRQVVTLGRHFLNHYEKFSIHGCTTNVLTPPPQRSVRAGSGHVFGFGIESADVVTKSAAKIIKEGSDKYS